MRVATGGCHAGRPSSQADGSVSPEGTALREGVSSSEVGSVVAADVCGPCLEEGRWCAEGAGFCASLAHTMPSALPLVSRKASA